MTKSRFGSGNSNWKGGRSINRNYPCPKCGKERICQAYRANDLCIECFKNRPRLKMDNPKYFTDRVRRIRIARKTKALQMLGNKCSSCGVQKLPQCCYHFHHVDSKSKEFNIGRLLGIVSDTRLFSELKKCVILCANCHAIQTWKEYEVK